MAKIEDLYNGIIIETAEDNGRNTVTVNGEVCTFDPHLVINVVDEKDALKFHEAFKNYIACEISSDELRLVAGNPKHHNSYGIALPEEMSRFNNKSLPTLEEINKIQNPNLKRPFEREEINHPSHYTQYKGIEVIEITEQLNFNRGNAVKYIARAGFKSVDTEIQDLEKALWYLNREISGWTKDGFKVPAWGSIKIMKLVGQMNFFKGAAVLHISRAGRPNYRATEMDDLELGGYYIRHELSRLKDL